MSQIERKWIEDQAINNQKVDPTDTYTITGLRIDETNAVGRIGVGLSSPLDALHIRRTDSSAGLMLDLVDGTDGQLYKIYSGSNGLLNFTDATDGGMFTYSAPGSIGRVGINTATVEDHVHVSSPSTDAALRLDLDDGVSGRAYRLVSDSDGAFKIIDVDGGSVNRFQISSAGTLTYAGDATFGSNFQINGTITVVNTEVVVTDQLEINQTDDQEALIVSQDTPGATATVMKIENAGSGHALTIDSGYVGIGTATPVSQLHIYDAGYVSINSGSADDYYSYGRFYNASGAIRVGKETVAGGTIFTDTGSEVGCVGTDTNDSLQFVTNNTVKMTLRNTGELGIGTSTPSTDLHMYSADVEKIRIETPNDVAGTQQTVAFYNNNSNSSFLAGGLDSSSNPMIAIGTVGGGNLYVNYLACVGVDVIPTEARLQVNKYSNSIPDLKLGTSATGSLSLHSYQTNHYYNEIATGTNEHLVLTTPGTGNVGIGATNPLGSFQISSMSVIDQIGSTATNLMHNTYFDGVDYRYLTTASASIFQMAGDIALFYKAPSGTAGTVASFSEHMRIDGAGNVGIGTNNPGELLSLYGSTPTIAINDGYADAKIWLSLSDLYMGTVTSTGLRFRTNDVNRMTIRNNGRVGIGTTFPGDHLEVYSATGASVSATNGTCKIRMVGSSVGYFGTDTNHELQFRINNSTKMTLDTAGNLGIGMAPTKQLQLSKDEAVKPSTNTWSIASDERIKENVEDYNKYGLKDLLKLRPISFQYNGKAGFENKGDERHVGYIAQEVEKIMPEMVEKMRTKLNKDDKEDTEIKLVNAHLINFALIEAIKELNDRLINLESKLA